MENGFYETKVVRAGQPGRHPTSVPLEDRLMALNHASIQQIMRERGVKGTALRDKREMVLRVAEDMREEQDEAAINAYEGRFGGR